MVLLTKSKYLLGLQCPKCLWTIYNDKDKFPEIDMQTQHVFDQGKLVGELAKSLFKDGIDIPTDNFMGNIRKTKDLRHKRCPLFEAGFMIDSLFARPDILNPSEDGWDIIEVKSSSSVKEVNIEDVSFQKHVYERFGLKIRRCFLMHINKEFVKDGDIDPEEFFVLADITEDVDSAIIGIEDRIKKMFDIIRSEECPEVKIGKDCSKPYECALHDDCWSTIPKSSVFDLYRGGKKCFELFDDGILKIKDIPDDFKLTSSQKIQKSCEAEGKNHIDAEQIKEFLEKLQYPLYYLDFETFNTAIPLFEGTRPYQQIPFQFSLHIQLVPGGELEHVSFLADGKDDPRPGFVSKLKEALDGKGNIIVYNQAFEIARMKECAECFFEHKDWIEDAISRIVDLLVPFRKFWYYDPRQGGSASIKKVLPVLVDKDYSSLDIADGQSASLEFMKIFFGKVSEQEKQKIRKDLEEYCSLDTEAMVWILDGLRKV